MNNTASLPLCILEEIGLEGLEGITLEGLWKRIGVRLKLPLPLNSRVTNDIWKFIQSAKCLQLYELPEEREPLKLFDRADSVDPLFGATEPETCPYNHYKYNPISYEGIRGSCENFDARKEVAKEDLFGKCVEEIEESYGRHLIIVASQSLRNSLLIPPTVSKEVEITISTYCILERVGRSRYNGELAQGKYSLADIGGDPVTFHSHKKKLQRNKLIECQSFSQNVDGTNTSNQLVHLPRFSALFKPRHMIIMEKIIGILKSKPNCMAEYHEVKGHFEEGLQRTVSRLFKSPFFHKFVLSDTRVPYRAIYPNATEREWKLKRDAERTVNVLQLRDPNIEPGQFKDMYEGSTDPVDDDEEGGGFLDWSHTIRDLPLLHQLYKLIDESKEKGVSETESNAFLGQSKLNGRALMKNLLRDKIIEYYTTSHKRQTIRRYILPKYNGKHKKSVDEVVQSSDEQSAAETYDDSFMVEMTEPIVKVEQSENIEHIEEIEVEVEEMQDSTEDFTQDDATEDDATEDDTQDPTYDEHFRTEEDNERDEQKRAIKNRIDEDIIVKITEINETNHGIPKKRLLKENKLTDKNKERIKFIAREVHSKVLFDDPSKLLNTLKRHESARGLTDIMCRKTFFRILTFMCQKGQLRLWRIEFQYKSKHRSLTYVSNKNVDSNFSLMQSCIDQAKSRFHLNIYEEECRKENKKIRSSIAKSTDTDTDTPDDADMQKNQLQKLNKSTNPSFNYGITPKFIRLRTLHEFMFYLAREHKSIELVDQNEVVAKLRETSPVAFEDMDEVPMIWNAEIGWRMFVPPLIKHNGFDEGWCLLSDCIFRMPLSIFVKVVNIAYEIKGLDEFISHPIKKHFLVKDIPVRLQQMLFARRKYVFSLFELLRRLICIGLVQAGPHRSMKDQAFYYMNRFASLIDTSSSLPGTYYVSEQDYTEMVYQFSTLDDVFTFWDDMHRICMSTKLHRRPTHADQTPADKVIPYKFTPYLKAIQPRQAKERDRGELPGDHRGAAGLDSYFFAHLERNWAFNSIKCRPKAQLKIKSETTPPTRYQRLVRMTRDVNLKKHESRMTPIPLHKLKSAAIRRRVPIVRKKTTMLKKKRVRNKYDDIDRMALQHMNKLRVDWNPQEDNFLLLCKVAQMYLNPSNRLSMPGQMVRDLIHWHCKSLNKTSYACRRRINYIVKKLPNSNQINNSIVMCLNEIKSNKSIQKRFGQHFIRNLRKVYPDENEFDKAFKIHFIDLVHMLSCQFYNLTNSFESNTLILPRTIQEFNARYCERNDSVYDSNTIRYDAPTSVDDVKIAQIVTLIHSTVCCSYDKTSWSIQLYEIYKDFPERMLSTAMRKVRSDQLISQNKLNSNHKVQNRCLPLSSSGFHLSATYQQQMTTKISYDIFDDAYENIKNILEDVNDRKWSHILNLSNSAVCFFISELSQQKNYAINIEIPKRILLLDPSKRLPDESFEGIYARFHEIFNYIPKVDLTGNDDSTFDDFISKLPNAEDKSSSTNEAKNIVKKLENLPPETLHFFCIVDNFGVSKPRTQIELTENGKCPYDCLRNLENPLENIMDKLVAKREVWYRLNVEQFEFEPLPAIVTIDENNIVAVYNFLVLKGANTTDEQRTTSLDLFKQISDIADELLLENDNEFIDEDFGAEYDLRSDVKKRLYDGAQINDKIHKFHDFLCVNTCKLSLSPAKEANDNNVLNLNTLCKKRDEILAKIVVDSNWSPDLKSDKDFVTLLKEKDMNMTEIHIAVDVFNYIDSQGETGANTADLIERYEDKIFLQKILDYFNEAKLVMKTGVCEVTYVHWKHIKPWVVNTYHLKRLDREATPPTNKSLLHIADASSTPIALKRKASESGPSDTKRTKVDDESTSTKEIQTNTTTAADESAVDSAASAVLSQDEPTKEPDPESSSKTSESESASKQTKPLHDSIIEHGEQMDVEFLPQIKKTFPIKMAPWIRVNGSVNRRVLDKYAGTILLHCIENVGLTLFTLCTRFHYLLPIHVYEIVQYLEEFGCITKTAMAKRKPITLFSKYESVKTGPATDLDDFRNIVIEPTIDAVTKMSIFIGNKKYKEDFI
ncbi:general transcription factor 3C polypeptide 1 isoform X2 [Sitodiplosis mosellana]|uniref:general transcription factor 3C polypeptide 1 isoform X2 n=1 Tax=Sitodiplosis mosellana TaxID=263140 RepID=UPI002443E3BB|nr:general transcription factor 3C polypeptide 1 isoform X2 [Sitodiplosis mosellana]